MTDSMGLMIGYGQYRSASTIAEMDQLLDETAELATKINDPVVVSLFFPDNSEASSHTVLFLGLGREWSILEWGTSGVHMYVPGDRDGNEPSAWWYSCDYSEYPPGRGVPIEIVRATAREFFRSHGQRPPWLNWVDEASEVDVDVDLADAS